MKKLLLLLTFTVLVTAEEPPAYLRDGKITVTLKNGKQYEFSTNEWKVVPRRGDEVAPEEAEEEDEPTYTKHEVRPAGPNRVRFMGGVGPTGGLEVTRRPDHVTVETEYGFVGGIGLDRSITDRISINGSAYTNGTISLGVGLDF